MRAPWMGDEQFLLPHRDEDGLLSQFSDDFAESLSNPAAVAPSQVTPPRTRTHPPAPLIATPLIVF
jgi:hypothetical protein